MSKISKSMYHVSSIHTHAHTCKHLGWGSPFARRLGTSKHFNTYGWTNVITKTKAIP